MIKAACMDYADKDLIKIKDLLVVNIPVNSLTEANKDNEK